MPLAWQFLAVCQTYKEVEKPKNLQPLPRHQQINIPEIEHRAGNMEGCNEEYNILLSIRLSRLFSCLRHKCVHHMKRTFRIYATFYLTPLPQLLAQSQNDFPRLRYP